MVTRVDNQRQLALVPILTVSHLTTRLLFPPFSYKVVDDLSFKLYPGKTLALVGESGCGKSMTALSLMRILPDPIALPSEGEVLYKGQNLLTIREKEMRSLRGARLAMIFQDPANALNPVYPIGDQLLEVVELHLDLFGEEARTKVVDALKDVGIAHAEKRFHDYPHQLSGGMRQRVMIAMALLCNPDILIADEPTTALDMTVQAQILKLIKEKQKEKNLALLLITHDLGIVQQMADEVLVMYASQAVESGPVEEVFARPGHPYTQGLLNSRPTLETAKEDLHPIKGSVPSLGHLPSGCHFHPRCPYAMPVCRYGNVPTFNCGQSHQTKCWLFRTYG